MKTNARRRTVAHLADRLMRLETVVTHLEQTIQDLDQMVLVGAKQLDAMNRRLESLSHQLGQVRESAAENAQAGGREAAALLIAWV